MNEVFVNMIVYSISKCNFLINCLKYLLASKIDLLALSFCSQ